MNWGKGITIFMIAFMSFIGSMVYYTFTRNADLVQDNYYESERLFDALKDNKQNYLQLVDTVAVMKKEDGVVFHFPDVVGNSTTGKISFYRPDQKKYDREFDLKVNADHEQVLDYTHFKEGYYDIRVEWSDEGQTFVFEDKISF